MRVLIAGAGVCGLTLAALLRRRGIDPVIVEKRPTLERSGFVLGIWPLGGRVLKELGLYEEFSRISTPLKRYSIVDGHGNVLQTYPVEFIGGMYGPIRMIQRGALIRLLAGSGDRVRTGISCQNVVDCGAELQAGFSNGSGETFDAVIGCDGIHSRVRNLVFGDIQPEPIGWRGWAWWVDPKLAREDTMTEYWEPGKWFCAVYPANGLLCAFAGIRTANHSGLPSDLGWVRDRLRAMDGFAPGILDYLGATENVFCDSFGWLRMREWRKGRVALAGDACSAVFPFGGLGIGASMAMESAYVIAEEISRTQPGTVVEALERYQTRRKPRAAVFEDASQGVIRGMLRPAPGTPTGREAVQRQREMFASFKRLLDQPL